MKKIFYSSILYLSSFSLVFAQDEARNLGSGPRGQFGNPIPGAKNLPELIDSISTVVLQLGVIVAALSIMYGGYQYVTAQGNEEKLGSAYKTITWSLVGTAVLLGAKVIIKVITSTVGGIADF